MFTYNLTVGYSDLMEVARLECHDGCYIALKRCQPGYYCTQPVTYNDSSAEDGTAMWRDGYMELCPPGTYRETSYHCVDQCLSCPPGRYHNEYKGNSLDSCVKCPAGTYAPKFQSTSILDCIHCQAGTFTKEEGAGSCTCITHAACAKDQLKSPADAEKRDTIPYNGLW